MWELIGKDWLLSVVLYIVYCSIAFYLWHEPRRVNKSREININLLKNRKNLKQANDRLRKKLDIFKLTRRIERFDRYNIYRLSMLLGLEFKSKDRYLPLEVVKRQIKDRFQLYPTEVIAAISIILSGSHY
ncbi:MAG: hypothetical protein ACFBSE_00705 [Prochloraceae cyanobacterium]